MGYTGKRIVRISKNTNLSGKKLPDDCKPLEEKDELYGLRFSEKRDDFVEINISITHLLGTMFRERKIKALAKKFNLKPATIENRLVYGRVKGCRVREYVIKKKGDVL